MVSSGDVADNGWTVGTEVDGHRAGGPLFDGPSVPAGTGDRWWASTRLGARR